MKVYVSGAMSGHPDLNFPAFHAETARLRLLGHEVINPAEINSDPNAEWAACLKDDIRALLDCDAIQMIGAWEKSRGAKLEHHVASQLGLFVFTPESALKVDIAGA